MKSLDFNSLKRPTLNLTMMDEAHTQVRVVLPKTETIRKLQDTLPELQNILKSGDIEGINLLYNLAAELINSNLDGFTTTGEALRTVYKLELEHLLVFYNVYLDYINEVKNAKN